MKWAARLGIGLFFLLILSCEQNPSYSGTYQLQTKDIDYSEFAKNGIFIRFPQSIRTMQYSFSTSFAAILDSTVAMTVEDEKKNQLLFDKITINSDSKFTKILFEPEVVEDLKSPIVYDYDQFGNMRELGHSCSYVLRAEMQFKVTPSVSVLTDRFDGPYPSHEKLNSDNPSLGVRSRCWTCLPINYDAWKNKEVTVEALLIVGLQPRQLFAAQCEQSKQSGGRTPKSLYLKATYKRVMVEDFGDLRKMNDPENENKIKENLKGSQDGWNSIFQLETSKAALVESLLN